VGRVPFTKQRHGWALMKSYVERTRPALSFVGIGIGLRDYPNATVHKTLGSSSVSSGQSSLKDSD
jgi:hypothetical protein